MRISKKQFPISLGVFFILLYPYTISIADKIFINDYVKIVLVLTGYAMLAFGDFSFQSLLHFKLWQVIYIAVVFLIIYNNKNWGSSYLLSDLFFILMIILLIVSLTNNDKWVVPCIKNLKFFSVFYAGCTIISRCIPYIYLNYIIHLMPAEYYNTLLGFYKNGFMAGLTQHYSINGIYLSIGTMLFATSSIGTKQYKRSDFIYGCACLFSLILTAKRAHLAFTVLALGLVLLLNAQTYTKIIKYGIGLVIVISLIYSLLIAFPSIFPVINRFKNIIDTGVSDRFILYTMALSLLKKNLFLGNGWCAFRHNYFGLHYNDLFSALDTHNIYLQLLAEVGILGCIIFLSFFIVNLRKALKCLLLIREANSSEYRKEVLFSLCLQIFFLFYGMTGNPLYDCQVFIPYLFCVGITNYLYTNKNRLKIMV